MIEMEHVTKMYGSRTALRDISFRIRKNETVGLLGRNGAGKTTMLNLMTGYFPPTEGQVRICGKACWRIRQPANGKSATCRRSLRCTMK